MDKTGRGRLYGLLVLEIIWTDCVINEEDIKWKGEEYSTQNK
jgi:hypothetical protein